MKTVLSETIAWVKKNRFEAFLLATILLFAAFLRLYRIDEYMTFLGDEGRDVIVVRKLLVNFDPILVGPGTSIGNMYLGPLYYYLMAPFLLLADFSPAGPAIMVAVLGILTVFFVWFAAREWFGRLAALVASALYAISPIVITYSKSSWNPNIMPFFSLLSIYSIWRVYQYFEFKWLLVLGISYAMVLNSHYLGLLLIPPLFVYWILTIIRLKVGLRISNSNRSDQKAAVKKQKNFWKYSFIGIFLFALLMSPVVLFDARHQWRNLSAIKTFFTERQTTVSARPWASLPKLYPLSEKVMTRLMSGANQIAGRIVDMGLIFSVVVLLYSIVIKRKEWGRLHNTMQAFLLILIWLVVAYVGLGAYKQEIYDHYYGFFFTAPFLLIGGFYQVFFDWVRKRNFVFRFFSYLLLFSFFLFLIFVNLKNSPLKYAPNRQLQRTEIISRKIADESGGREFNLAVIAERNYEGAYQYFLEKWNAPLIMIDPQRADQTITSQLFVVCELPKDKCDPTHDSKAGIANFGWSKIANSWEIGGNVLFKLVHY